jgi:hypothetical protein
VAAWICTLSLAWWFLLRDIFAWILFLKGIKLQGTPSADALESLLTITLALLGLGAMRTVEKVRGISEEESK